ncbi:hypothetical protein AAMO2058_000904500 [Amorphochlora amoebiformis]
MFSVVYLGVPEKRKMVTENQAPTARPPGPVVPAGEGVKGEPSIPAPQARGPPMGRAFGNAVHNFSESRLHEMINCMRSAQDDPKKYMAKYQKVNMTNITSDRFSFPGLSASDWDTDSELPPYDDLETGTDHPTTDNDKSNYFAPNRAVTIGDGLKETPLLFPDISNIKLDQPDVNKVNTKKDYWMELVTGSSEYALKSSDGTGTNAMFVRMGNVCYCKGKYYILDPEEHNVRVVDKNGTTLTLAGGSERITPDKFDTDPGRYMDHLELSGMVDGRGSFARFSTPTGIDVHPYTGDIYVADQHNNRIRKISPTGLVTTFAGTGDAGYLDGPASLASFHAPSYLKVDADRERIIVSDTLNHVIRVIHLKDHTVHRLAGNRRGGDVDGPFRQAEFNFPEAVVVHPSGDIYVADMPDKDDLYNVQNIIRRLSSNGEVSTVVGAKKPGYMDGIGTNALFNSAKAMALSSTNDTILVADQGNEVVRKVRLEDFEVTSIVAWGYPITPFSQAIATFNRLENIACDENGFVVTMHTPTKLVRFRPMKVGEVPSQI